MSNLDSMGMFQNASSLLMIQDILWLSSSDTLPTGDLLFRKVIASLMLHLNLFVEAAIFFVSVFLTEGV